MNFPIWEPWMANSTLIAVVAILHVFVAHFAIGGGLYLVWAELWARRKNDPDHLAYLERHSRFFVLTTLVFAAVTGVGIWVTIGLIHPTGTGWLISNFVWGWATEWALFLVEIAAAIIYYYGWKRLTPAAHLTVGWIYFVAAWLSLAVINGILTFMLTPGRWLATGNFWDGFFNPTFLPSTLFRTCLCLILAGLFATFTVAKESNAALKVRIMRRNGLFILLPLLLAIPLAWWYYQALPDQVRAGFIDGTTPTTALQVMIFMAGLLALLSFLGTIIFPRYTGYISSGILLLCGLLVMGGFEWSREAIRKPYLIYDFLYSNNLLKNDAAALPAQAPLDLAFTTGDRGRDLYLYTCRSCHTLSGYKGLAPKLAGLEEEHIANIIPRLQHFLGGMPPFPGDGEDAATLASYLAGIADPDPLAARPDLDDRQKQMIVFTRRCGGCHSLTGFRGLGETFGGLSAEDAEQIVLSLPDLTEEMPPFTGSDAERQLLIEYLIGGSNE